MTKTMYQILILVGIGWMFDAMDQGMVSGVLAAVGQTWELSTLQQSILASAGTFGMILGAALSGAAADRFGRRTVIVFTLTLYSIGSLLCGLAASYAMLVTCRFITGFGLGGELPAASTLVSEFSPKASRGRNVVLLESFWAWGWIAAALIAYLLIPVYGWRIAFIVGALPAFFAAVLRRKVPESPRYLELSGETVRADQLVSAMEAQAGITMPDEEKTPIERPQKVKGAFAKLWSKPHLRSTVVLWVIWFGINFGYYGFVLWTPTLLMAQGFTMVRSFGFTVIMCLAQLPGYFSAAWLIERIGRKPTLIIYFAGTALASWLFGHAGSESAVLASGCLLYFFALGAWGCVYSYSPEVYPTEVRGSGTGWAAAFGRVGAFIAPFVVPAVYASFGEQAGFTAVFVVLAAAFAITALVIALAARETKGQPLTETF
ncbi:MAG: MFS transporter [Eggerthellaceae bacterium]|nr:MFS transporter [Eggerthellaceae bacterium]